MSRKKSDIYVEERNEVLTNLMSILRISKERNLFISDDITEEIELSIKELIPDIKRYYKCSTWAYFRDTRKIVSLIKSILNEMGLITRVLYVMDPGNRKIEKKGYYIYGIE